jgi:hypothetical protein
MLQNQERKHNMSEVKTKRPLLSRRAKVILALAVIFILVVLSFFAPPEGDSNNVTGDSPVTPTVSITHLVGTLIVNHGAVLSGVQITVTQVQEAATFSNDRKRGGTFTVRVYVQTLNGGHALVGIDYSSQVRLLLPGGQVIAPKYVTVAPVSLPNQKQDGYFDFPVPTQVDLSSLMLRLGSEATVAFTG